MVAVRVLVRLGVLRRGRYQRYRVLLVDIVDVGGGRRGLRVPQTQVYLDRLFMVGL